MLHYFYVFFIKSLFRKIPMMKVKIIVIKLMKGLIDVFAAVTLEIVCYLVGVKKNI